MICVDRIKYLAKNEEELSDCLSAFTVFLYTRQRIERHIKSNSKLELIRQHSSPRVNNLLLQIIIK